MRPALLRLLKRPSAVSILDTLASTSIGIEQLETCYTRLRTQPVWTSTKFPNKGDKTEDKARDKAPFDLLSIHDIEHCESHVPELPQKIEHSPDDQVITALSNQYEKLKFESDIGHTNDLGTRLIDQPEYKNNFELWQELLRFRQQYLGKNDGTAEIWRGLMYRVEGVRLPPTGADFLWKSFLELALVNKRVSAELVGYALKLAKSEAECWPMFHKTLVGGLLDRGSRNAAMVVHRKLLKANIARPEDLALLLRALIWPSCLKGKRRQVHDPYIGLSYPTPLLKIVRDFFRRDCLILSSRGDSSPPPIYHSIMRLLLWQGWGAEALYMHKFLTYYGDHPTDVTPLLRLMDQTQKFGSEDDYRELLRYHKKNFPGEKKSLNSSKSDLKETGTPPEPLKSPKHDLGTRLFATRAFNFDLVIGGLRMLRVQSIGPESLREMAMRAHGAQDILKKIKLLEGSGISIDDCVFSRLVKKLALQRREILLSDLLKTDQHPDLLEDPKMQEHFLISYYLAQDWPQYNIALAALVELFPQSTALWNIHFRKHITAGELEAASKVVDEMALHQKFLRYQSLEFMNEHVLSPRREGHRPPPVKSNGVKEQVMYVFKIYRRTVSEGGYVPAEWWVELLKRLGKSHHWDELRECCLWLTRHYAVSTDFQVKPSKIIRDDRMLPTIFASDMQQAIILWGFYLRVVRRNGARLRIPHPLTGEKMIPWVRGYILLREMEQAGAFIAQSPVKRATQLHMAQLYGPTTPSARRLNRMLRRKNPYSFMHIIRHIDLVWGEKLLTDDEVRNPREWLTFYRTTPSLMRTARIKVSPRRG